VDGLERAEKVTSSRNFFDKNRCKSFIAQLLEDAEEVDLDGPVLGSRDALLKPATKTS
jgi:hypothetical protein